MAGMVPKRRSKDEIQRANQELLDRNRAYMQRWLESRLHSASPEAAQHSIEDSETTESAVTDRCSVIRG
jgi:hypothetical protein